MTASGPRGAQTIGGVAAAIALIAPFITQHEGRLHKVYHDLGGVLTVCDGHTGKDIRINHVYTDAECVRLRAEDMQKAADSVLKVTPSLENKIYTLAATISFVYNLGIGTYQRSSVARDFNAGNYKQGCADMLKYTYIGKQYNQGLANRRRDEYNVCIKGL